ncbi:MAG: hypothetical protein LBD06_09185 [Candidatus Accumulibacter sp.]|nr:hypothetical protein [Accumulibacter sp.]
MSEIREDRVPEFQRTEIGEDRRQRNRAFGFSSLSRREAPQTDLSSIFYLLSSDSGEYRAF